MSSKYSPLSQSDYASFGSVRVLPTGFAMRRITDNNAGYDHGVHRYSKQQIWNADESVLDIGDRLIDAKSLKVIEDSVDLSTARNWSYTDPEKFFGIKYVDGLANSLGTYNYVTDVYQENYRFAGYDSCTFGSGEGNVSIDERYVLVACKERSGDQMVLLSVDIVDGVLLGKIRAKSNYNWASFSQSGEYIVVENNSQDNASQTELVRYNPDLSNRYVLSKTRHHSDLGRDVNGDDVIVMIDWDYISYIRLKDGLRVNLDVSSPEGNNAAGHGHISCRNIRRPGWCYFSSYDRNLVGAVKLAQSDAGRYTDNEGHEVVTGIAEVEIWGHHNSDSGTYQAAPKVTVSPTGSSLVFSSDWYGTAAADDYLLSIAD